MTCFLCHSDNKNKFAEAESFGFPLVYFICENCGLVYQSTETSQVINPDFYAETYRKIYQDNPNPTKKDLWVQEQRANHLVDLVHSHCITPPKSYLDIGASTGTLLLKFKQAFGCKVTGVEPGSAYRSFAEKNGLSMLTSIDELIPVRPNRFDLISLVHVLEHLPDPIDTLKRIKADLLSENGRLLLEVPNLYMHDSFELAHLTCFSSQKLVDTVQQAGYEVQFIARHGIPRSDMLKLYITLIAKPLSEGMPRPIIKKEPMVRIKRQFGMGYRRVVQRLFPNKAWLLLPNEVGR